MKIGRKTLLAILAAGAGLRLDAAAATAQLPGNKPGPAVLTPEEFGKIPASPVRSAADRTNDLRRKPADMLARPIGPTGQVHGQSRPRNPGDPRDRNTPDPPQPKDEFVLKFAKP